MNSINVKAGQFVHRGEEIGAVGNTGNAKNRPPHLHYAIISLFPYYWRKDKSTQGWKKMYFLNPGKMLLEVLAKK